MPKFDGQLRASFWSTGMDLEFVADIGKNPGLSTFLLWHNVRSDALSGDSLWLPYQCIVAEACRKSDFVVGSIFPLLALSNRLSFDRRKQALFQPKY